MMDLSHYSESGRVAAVKKSFDDGFFPFLNLVFGVAEVGCVLNVTQRGTGTVGWFAGRQMRATTQNKETKRDFCVRNK